MKKAASILVTGVMLASLCTPAFASVPQNVAEGASKTYTIQELQNDPNVSFMDQNSIIQTRSSSYMSYIDVGVNSSVYGEKRYFDSGTFGSRLLNIQVDKIENSGKLKVSLCKVNAWGSYTSVKDTTKSITSSTKTETFGLGYQDKGDWAFQYTTSGSLKLYADVAMYSNS